MPPFLKPTPGPAGALPGAFVAATAGLACARTTTAPNAFATFVGTCELSYVSDIHSAALHRELNTTQRFDIRTGQVRRMPASAPIRTYPVRVEDGQVWIELSEDE